MPPIIMYSTPWCGHCRRLKRQLEEAGIEYREVDLDEQPEHGAKIIEATGGYRTVPTVEIEGRLLVNPPVSQVEELLARRAS